MIRPRTLALAALAAFALAGAVLADDLYDDKRESFQSDQPKIEVTRPDAGWMFVRIDAQRQEAEAARPGASAEFQGLVARLHAPATKATISVFSFPLASPPPDMARLSAHARDEAKARKDGAVADQSQVSIGGRDVVMTDYTATIAQAANGAAAGDQYLYSRIDVIEPECHAALVILFEVPREKATKALPGWKRVLQKLKLA